MKRRIDVFVGESRAGVLHHDVEGRRESSAFVYDEEWLRSPDAFAIDPTLRLVSGPQFRAKTTDGSIFHGVIADTEPDGWGRRVMMRDHAKRRTKSSAVLNRLDFLLEVDDESRVGALRFRDERGVFCRPHEPGHRTVPPLIELGRLAGATRAVETSSETDADLAYLRGRGTSLGGLRPKCTVIDDDGRLSIGKFPSVADERTVTKGEVLALRLARLAGIDAADARLIDSDGVPVALIARFDRSGKERVLYMSAATALGVDARDPGEHSYTEIVDAIRTFGASPKRDIEELWRRIAFTILITNVDDHLLNHGFLHREHGQWSLAPAFDVNPFPDRVRELKTWISPETGPEASIDSLMTVAPHFSIKAPRAKEILEEVERSVGRWRVEGRALGMTKAELDAFESAFEHEERLSARRA